MKKMLLSAAFACAALTLPASAMADDAMKSHDAMAAPTATAMMICRPATANEVPTAMTTATKTALVCKTVPAALMKKGPDLSPALTSDQVDAAWRKFTESMMIVTGGG
ncbi:MAG: hypothetical protein M3154_01665 [Candidatus Eremiobacteraeota bacterium]|nr:hypothetical protein [Candidatus Eremiobacteraeota bacterium]